LPTRGLAVTEWFALADLIARLELLVPPRSVVPRLAYEERLTLLAAPEKSGKSTLLRQAVAAMRTGGKFLGEEVRPAPAVWLALDEPLGDVTRGLYEAGARDGVTIAIERPEWDELETTIAACGAKVLVIDTLTEFLAGLVESQNDARQVQPVLANLRAILAGTGCAGVLLHHTTRGGDRYAGSFQFGAGVDVVIEMTPTDVIPNRRRCRVRARVEATDFEIDYDGERYDLASGELPLGLRIPRAIEVHPGASTNCVRRMVVGKHATIDAALRDLLLRGAIEDRPNVSGHAYYVKRPVAEAGGPRQPGVARGVGEGEVTPLPVSDDGPMGGVVGRDAGRAAAPLPYTGERGVVTSAEALSEEAQERLAIEEEAGSRWGTSPSRPPSPRGGASG